MGFIGAVAIALGLSFGLGARETAGEIVRDWYQSAKESKANLSQAADAVKQEARKTSWEDERTARPIVPGNGERFPRR